MKRLAAWWFAPAPAERLAALRILVGGFALVYTAIRLPEIARVASYGAAHFQPYGVVRVLSHPLPPALAITIAVATVLLLAAFVAGVAYRIVAPLAAVALLWTLTYRNCFGMLFHTENLLVLHMLALAVAPDPRRPSTTGHGWPIKLMATLTVVAYLLAGVAKLRIAGVGWIDGELLRNQIAVDNLRKAVLGDSIAPLAGLVLNHPAAMVPFAAVTMLLELGAPLALCGRRLGYAWAVGAWAFHAGVVLLMNIWFVYPLSMVALMPLLPAERVISVATRFRRKHS